MEYHFTYRQKDKGVQVILSYKDSKGRWKQKSRQGFKTKKFAQAAGDKMLDEIKESALNVVDESMKDVTLREVFELFLLENKAVLEYNTRAVYSSALIAFKDIADMPVSMIQHQDIIKCLSQMPFAVSTKKVYKGKLNRILKYAIYPCHIISNNPVEGIQTEKDKRQRKVCILEYSDFKNLLYFAKEYNYMAYVKIAIAGYAGLRYGEILGLTWNTVDLKNGRISVETQLSAIGKKKYGLKPTKSMNGYRVIPIPPDLITILKTYHQSVPERLDRHLFNDKTNSTFTVNYVIRKSGNKNMSIHSLRHTYATRLLANGVDVKTVAAL